MGSALVTRTKPLEHESPQIVLHTPPQCTNRKAVTELLTSFSTVRDTDEVKATHSLVLVEKAPTPLVCLLSAKSVPNPRDDAQRSFENSTPLYGGTTTLFAWLPKFPGTPHAPCHRFFYRTERLMQMCNKLEVS
jgi:hypothetical protein